VSTQVARNATPALRRWEGDWWGVYAHPYGQVVGYVDDNLAGWVAHKPTGQLVGLYPTKQAAAEVLVKQAGYELEQP
jgi:hypothetical protein